MVYFAYGSNMYTPRLRYRVKSAKVVGVGTLAGYELRWHKRSKDGSGKCNAVASQETSELLGVLYEIHATEKPLLDRVEGVGAGYHCEDVEVQVGGKTVKAFTYLADANYIDDKLPVY